MKHKFCVKVMPRQVILDTQGRAIEQTLKLNQLGVSSCRVGKWIELELEALDSEPEKAALDKVHSIARLVLHNPLIETYEIEKKK